MKRIAIILVLGLSSVYGRSFLKTMFPKKYPPMMKNGIDPGKPVFLTPLIEQGKFDDGMYICMEIKERHRNIKIGYMYFGDVKTRYMYMPITYENRKQS